MMRRAAALCALLLAIAWPGASLGAQEETVLQGEIVNPAAYLKDGARGPAVVEQSYEAVEAGQTLALLDDATSTLYLLLADAAGQDPNELVYEYVNQRVKLTGVIYERDGVKGVVVTNVEPLAPEPSETQAVPPT
jgi:hypothetical protein